MDVPGKYKLLVLTICISLLPLYIFSFPQRVNEVSILEIIDASDDPINVIVLDPGHGGKDVGCHGNSLYEKDVALEIARKVGLQIIQKFPEIEVRYTRLDDTFVPLHERVNYANSPDVDLFISIHCNANHNSNAKGIETYVMGLHTSEENMEIAKRENDVIKLEDLSGFSEGYDPYSNEGHIMIAMRQQTTLEKSIVLADYTQHAFDLNTDFRNRGVKQAGFVVLRKVVVPSILVEAGFVSNVKDAKQLNSEKVQEKIATSIVQGIGHYIAHYNEQ